MKLVMTTVIRGDADLIDAHFAFHLNAGVDFVIATGAPLPESSAEVVESYASAGLLRRLDMATPTEMARLAMAEHGADWLIPGATEDFWWPRGESLKDVLSVIPARYSVVQALVRTFVGPHGTSSTFAEERTARTSLLASGESVREPQQLLRPVYRAEPNMEVDEQDWTLGGRRIPLRAWYPLELLRFPSDSQGIDDAQMEALLGARTLVVDTRLRDALRLLRVDGSRYAIPRNGSTPVTLPVPTIVDDASYAIECAAVGEVDLVKLDKQIRELEMRIAALESRFWPRVRRVIRRLARRRS